MENGDERRGRPCGGLLGCGDDGGRQYMVEPDVVEAALTPPTRDRLQHMDELNQDALEPHLATYRVSRRRLVGVSGVFGLLATVAPSSLLAACATLRRGATAAPGGRTHVVESTPETVRLGAFDATRPDILQIDSGDTVVYPNTWTHFLNRFQRGGSRRPRGRGPHRPGRRELRPARPARRQHGPARASGGDDPLHPRLAAGRENLHGRFPRAAGRRRGQPHRARDRHA